jgi:hypothetical protein
MGLRVLLGPSLGNGKAVVEMANVEEGIALDSGESERDSYIRERKRVEKVLTLQAFGECNAEVVGGLVKI